MQFSRKKNFVVVFLATLPLIFIFFFAKPVFLTEADSFIAFSNICKDVMSKVYSKHFVYDTIKEVDSVEPINPAALPSKLPNPPSIVKAVYVTGWSAGNKNYLNYLNQLFKTTQINAVVVDVKDYSGIVSYKSNAPKVREYKTYQAQIPDINALVKSLHDQNIYVIGRIAVFEDPALAKARKDLAVYDKAQTTDILNPVLWQDNNHLSWVDPASKEVWDYNISIAKDALMHGFDEINFDYIRFPSDGKTENMGFPIWDAKQERHLVIKEFFQKLRESLPDEKISADIFGQTTINTDDMGIGQILEDAFEYFDYICPMVYPSHYVSGFIGYNNPSQYPYEVIKYSIDSAVKRRVAYDKLINKDAGELPKKMAQIRPWLQDFNMGADYTADMVKQEIKALEDSIKKEYVGYLMWNPSNIYTKEAIAK
ncbi:MAG: hypothetical protein A2644_01760 [Candidatus Zambryskibacteria bacterium RIFCSPHIGHO2_01_FULL_39_63]|uniref:DUF4015 domain-containing protein n=1 Tax=Candidatus Staskawiczbacteria bacterium RIFCSPHIGHO2_12_FULL_38_11 TaxID=1802209 RepID=A0A1G2I6J3_9BACT|nr:MAG: hypothetical protein A3F47_00320 [Candidatus Staskawiczbacteria bacterium RIFCSPHIGHO2_12_FULL_38_11]OHA87421.1 MAG: hypothetical protein A2644_01760 [Candidatus Zambryskibacteria bacterium RIFCSPHIGHO2_01_FULL_39_63]